MPTCFDQVARGDDRIHESVRIGLVAASGQMKDYRSVLHRHSAVIRR